MFARVDFHALGNLRLAIGRFSCSIGLFFESEVVARFTLQLDSVVPQQLERTIDVAFGSSNTRLWTQKRSLLL